MTDKKYADKEIEKALSLCGRTTTIVYCDQCPLCGEYECNREIKVLALDLINHQKSEIERLHKENKILSRNADTAFQDGLNECRELFAPEIKAEAYKTFAEKLREEFLNLQYNAKTDRKNIKIEELKEQMNWLLHTVAIETVENLLKEMISEEE